MALQWQMVVAEHPLGVELCTALLGSVNEKSWIVVVLKLAALNILDPAMVGDFRDGGALCGVGVEH